MHIAKYADDDVNYNLLSLCRSPLRTIPEKLAESIKSTIAVENALSAGLPDWKMFVEGKDSISLPLCSNASFRITQDLIDAAHISDMTQQSLNKAGPDAIKLLELYRECMQNQRQLQALFMNEEALISQEDEQAKKRKHDRTPAIYSSIKTLAEEGVLKNIIQDLRTSNG